jgi:hypothetical protein
MDALTDFFVRLLARTGLTVNTEVTLIVAFALAVMIVAIGLALSRRRGRLEDRLVVSELGMVDAPRAPSDGLSDSDRSKQQLGDANWGKSPPSGALPQLAVHSGSMREAAATNPPNSKSQPVTDQAAVQNYEARIELLQATLNSLQREQATLHKLLEACNAGLKGIEQLVAAIPGLRIEHASIKKQLAELNTRFDAASEVLAEVLQSEDLLHDPKFRDLL